MILTKSEILKKIKKGKIIEFFEKNSRYQDKFKEQEL